MIYYQHSICTYSIFKRNVFVIDTNMLIQKGDDKLKETHSRAKQLYLCNENKLLQPKQIVIFDTHVCVCVIFVWRKPACPAC